MPGIELIRLVSDRLPDIDIIAHSVLDDRDTVFAAIRAGAYGYVLKGGGLDELLGALRLQEAPGPRPAGSPPCGPEKRSSVTAHG